MLQIFLFQVIVQQVQSLIYAKKLSINFWPFDDQYEAHMLLPLKGFTSKEYR